MARLEASKLKVLLAARSRAFGPFEPCLYPLLFCCGRPYWEVWVHETLQSSLPTAIEIEATPYRSSYCGMLSREFGTAAL